MAAAEVHADHVIRFSGERLVMLLKEFCTTDVAWCTRDTTVLEAAQMMRQKHIGDLVIVDDPKDEFTPVGLITDRDIVVKVIGDELSASQTRVGAIMRMPLVTASESEDSSVAISRMRHHGVRRLPVTGHRGKLVGIVTLDDLLRQLRSEVDSLLEIISKERDHEQRTTR
jgi:CBS domain-containing protein